VLTAAAQVSFGGARFCEARVWNVFRGAGVELPQVHLL